MEKLKQIAIRTTPEVREEIKVLAKTAGVSLNEYILFKIFSGKKIKNEVSATNERS